MGKNESETIRKIVEQLINQEGGFFLPNIQRHFVWKEEQIEKLFDSIMREYPIGSLLVWKTKSEINLRDFIKNYSFGDKLKTGKSDTNTKYLILDGQQRLQSIFIALKGTYNKKELYFDILSGDKKHPEEISYKFSFLDENKIKFPWIKFKDLVLSKKETIDLEELYFQKAKKENFELNSEQITRVKRNISKVKKILTSDDVIIYQKLDQIDNPELYDIDDIVEVFIRANSGGTQLSKSDLIFSLLTSSWEDAEESMDELLHDLNKNGYNFSRDFVLKACLTILNKGARYNVNKVRQSINDNEIMDQWAEISNSIRDVKDFLFSKTFLKSDKAIPSYLLYIPLIYFRFHYREQWNNKKDDQIINYILRTSLAGSFSGTPDNLIDRCVKSINEKENFILEDIFDIIKEDGRSINISENQLLNLQYGSKEAHLIFNLWYKDFDYSPSFKGNDPQVDHIFPQSELRKHKNINPDTGRSSIFIYPQNIRDQLANLALLTSRENGASGKLDILPNEWFRDKTKEYLDMHLIPKEKELWEVENFDKFIEKRKQLIIEKFGNLIIRKENE